MLTVCSILHCVHKNRHITLKYHLISNRPTRNTRECIYIYMRVCVSTVSFKMKLHSMTCIVFSSQKACIFAQSATCSYYQTSTINQTPIDSLSSHLFCCTLLCLFPIVGPIGIRSLRQLLSQIVPRKGQRTLATACSFSYLFIWESVLLHPQKTNKDTNKNDNSISFFVIV